MLKPQSNAKDGYRTVGKTTAKKLESIVTAQKMPDFQMENGGTSPDFGSSKMDMKAMPSYLKILAGHAPENLNEDQPFF